MIFDLADADPVDGRPYEVKKIKVAAREAGNPWVKGSKVIEGRTRDTLGKKLYLSSDNSRG